jgi:hypothetical protein
VDLVIVLSLILILSPLFSWFCRRWGKTYSERDGPASAACRA